MGAVGRINNAGQCCVATKRLIVVEGIAGLFLENFMTAMAALKMGDPMDEATTLAPLSSMRALETLEDQVNQSVAKGACLVLGGKRADGAGAFMAPTILTGIKPGNPAYSEEFFGPVASIFRVKDVEEAIRIANDTRFGLGASVWTRDTAERTRLIDGVESGMVFVNKMVVSDPRVPFGGIKQSGFGRELGQLGIREFTNIKTVWIEK